MFNTPLLWLLAIIVAWALAFPPPPPPPPAAPADYSCFRSNGQGGIISCEDALMGPLWRSAFRPA